MDFLDAGDGEDFPGGAACELIGAVARTDGNGKRIQLRGAHKFGGLIGIGQKLIAGHFYIRTVTVFLVALHGFK